MNSALILNFNGILNFWAAVLNRTSWVLRLKKCYAYQ